MLYFFPDSDAPITILSQKTGQVRGPADSLATFTDEEGTYYMKVAPWETNGVYEIWEFKNWQYIFPYWRIVSTLGL